MKVQGLSTNQDAILKNLSMNKNIQEIKTKGNFKELLKNDNKEKIFNTEKVKELIDNIETVKKTLEHDLTVENLKKYKEAIKSYLSHYTKNELYMEDFFVKDKRSLVEKRLSVIKSVDDKLNDLTENLLDTNRGHLEALNKIGDINGLILNIYI